MCLGGGGEGTFYKVRHASKREGVVITTGSGLELLIFVIDHCCFSMIKGDLAAVAVTVSFGALLGKTSHHQLLIISFIEVVIYSVNRAIAVKFFHAVDAGSSIFVHSFGAYFGLAVSRVLYSHKVVAHDKEISRYTSDIFATLGKLH